jgi:hypothetical protein
MTHDSTLTRRQVLAGLGAVGLVASGPHVVRGARGDPPFTRYTLAGSTDGPDLRIAWYELYNGQKQEDSNRFTAGGPLDNTEASFNESAEAGRFVDTTSDVEGEAVTAGPVISLGNVVPGDTGALVVGLLAEGDDASVWMRLDVREYAENTHVEPERVDGDLTPNTGELQDELDVKVWYDNGSLTGCNGRVDGVESFVTAPSNLGDANGSFADVAAALSDGVRLDFGLIDDGCIPAGRERCVSFAWEIPADTGNAIQTDGIDFDVEFAVVACDDDVANPFEGVEVTE